jgi:hypothetical protein
MVLVGNEEQAENCFENQWGFEVPMGQESMGAACFVAATSCPSSALSIKLQKSFQRLTSGI